MRSRTFLWFCVLLVGCTGPAGEVVSVREAGVPLSEEPPLTVLLRQIGEDLAVQLKSRNAGTLAVAGFADLAECATELGELIAERLTTELVKVHHGHLLERRLLARVLGEQGLNLSHLADSENAQSIGKLTGADALLTGTLVEQGPRITLNVRIVTTEQGRIVAAASGDIVNDEAAMPMLHKRLTCREPNREHQKYRIEIPRLVPEEPASSVPQNQVPEAAPSPRMPQHRVVIQQAIHLQPGEHRAFEIAATKGETLTVESRSLLPIDLFFLDAENFELFRRRKQFTSLPGGAAPHLTRGTLMIPIPASGQYILLVATQVTNLMPRRVTIKVELIRDIDVGVASEVREK